MKTEIPSILIVEDEAIVAADLAGKLRRLGYEIAGTAAAGAEAVALAWRLRPQLVLMDIRLEGPLDGIEAAEAIRRRQDVPVIYLTAHSDPATLARAKFTGPFGYILKPFEERELATQIELALHKHQADRQVREQREWLRVTLTSIGDAVIAVDAAGRISFVNPVAESLTGWKAEEAIGQPVPRVFRIVNEQTDQALEEPLARVLREGRAVALANHAVLVTRDGRTVPVEDSAAPILDAQGQVIGAVLVFHDVTEKRRAEEALQASEQRLQRSQEIAHLGSWELDLQTNELIWSDEVYRIFGLQPQQFGATYEAFLAAVHPDDRQKVDAAYSSSLRDDSDFYEIEHRIVRPDGDVRYVRERCEHYRDNSGRIIRSAGMVHDITEQKRADDALRASELEQSRQRQFLETLLNNAQACIAVMQGRELRYTLVNRAYQSLRPEMAMIGRTYREVFPDAAAAGAEALLQKVIETGEPHADRGYHAPVPGKPDAAWDHQIVRLPVEDGEAPSVLVITWDATDHKRAQEALERSNKELEQFAYVASHDLQEPLRAVVGFLQLLQSRYDNQIDEKGRHFIERSVQAGHRMQTLIRQLLTLSRVNTKGATFAATDINQIVKEVLDNLQSLFQEKNTDITRAELPNLSIDASQIRSLFQNLILNALRYNESPKPIIEIGCREHDSVYQFFVKDNGIGIAPQFYERIFMVFQRLHTDREYPGTGLGLALCKKIVERHGGTIWVESQPQVGSTFYFTLPKEE